MMVMAMAAGDGDGDQGDHCGNTQQLRTTTLEVWNSELQRFQQEDLGHPAQQQPTVLPTWLFDLTICVRNRF